MTIEDDTPHAPRQPLSPAQAHELAKMLTSISIERTKADNEFKERIRELTERWPPEPAGAVMELVKAWENKIEQFLSLQATEVYRILGVPDQGDEPTETLQ